MLEKLGFKKRIHVGISLSANNFIELVCVNNATKTVEKYASGNIKYNSAIREIIDFDEFKEVLEGLFDDAGLDPAACSVTLNIPNVFFAMTIQESVAEAPFIIENLQSEIEDSYIFKRNEPIIRYCALENKKNKDQKTIVYSAMQAKIVEKLVEIFDEMNVDLVRIDTSYSTLLKAIQYCNRFNKYIQKDEKTAIVLVTPNSCCAFYLNENIIVDCIEEPLAIKSYSAEEVYASISKIATNLITQNRAKSLLIISETDEVDSELLSQGLTFDGEIDCINKTINTNEQFIDIQSDSQYIDTNMISYMTIEAVGAAVADYDDYPLNGINFIPEDRINENLVPFLSYEVDLKRFALLTILTGVITAGLISIILNTVINLQIDNNKDISGKYAKSAKDYKEQSDKYNSGKDKKDIIVKITQISELNKDVINIYSALSSEAPPTLYIKTFVTNPSGGIGILGEAKTTEDVYKFLEALKEKNKDLMISKVSDNSSLSTKTNIPNGYTFEIKTSNVEVALYEKFMEESTPTSGPQQQQGFLNNLPMFNNNPVAPPPPISLL